MSPDYYVPKKYVSLNDQKRHHHSNRGKKKCGCLRWCCCCICSIILIIIMLVAIGTALYYFLEPKVPTYNVENLEIKAFDLQSGDKLHAGINVVLKAVNPNQNIALDYLNNDVKMIYSGSTLCSGKFPPIKQPGHATTNLNVTLKGDIDFGSELQSQLFQDQKIGRIPLLIMVKVPIKLVIVDFIHLRKFFVDVNCSMVIDQLLPGKRPNILKKDVTYDIHL